jgi:gliding motility-associated-like protein
LKTLFRISTLLAWAFLGSLSAYAQEGQVTSTKGTDFWMTFMNNYTPDPQESLDLFIASSEATSGTISVPGQGWSINFVVNPNQTTTVSIPTSVAEMHSSEIVENRGVHIVTQDTVSVFAISFNPYTADATKVLPTTTLGTNYYIASYAGLSPWDSELAVVATEDDTEIEIIPSCNTLGGHPANTPMIVQLDQGEVFQIIAEAGEDLTGTRITATDVSGSCRPFGVFSGAGCANVPGDCGPCDHLFEQNFPIELWGTEYFITPFVFEVDPYQGVLESNYTYRILAQQNGTIVSVDGAVVATLNAGEYHEIQYDPSAHCVQGNHEIAVIQYMESLSCGGNGDPSMIVLDDATKKIDNVTFSTVQSTVINRHYLNVIVENEDVGSVTLDGVVISPTLFHSFSACSSHKWAGFEITAGSHTLDAPDGVTAYVYGNGFSESYAYSVGSFTSQESVEIDYSFCTDTQVNLQLSNSFFSPYWYELSNPDLILHEGYSYTVNPPISNGVFVGVGSHFASGCEETVIYSVESAVPPAIALSPSAEMSICQFQSVQLNAQVTPSSQWYQYSWTPDATLSENNIPNPVASPQQTTTYQLAVSTLSGCASSTQQVTIDVGSGNVSRMDASVDDAFLCLGEETSLHVKTEKKIWADDINPGVAWGDWFDINNGQENMVCGSVSGNALYFNGSGERSAITPSLNCTTPGTIYFALKIASGTAPCDNAEPGDNVVLEYSTNGASWTVIQTFNEANYPDFVNLAIPIPAAAMTNHTQFKWKQVGTWFNNQDNWVIDEVFIAVEKTQDFNYTWSPAASLNNASAINPLASPAEQTSYIVTMTDGQTGCTYQDSVLIEVGQPFDLTVSNDTTLCDLNGLALSASVSGNPADYSFEWQPSASLDNAHSMNPQATPQATTNYTVAVTSPIGCTQSESVLVSVGYLMGLNASVSDEVICEGSTVDLEAIIAGSANDLIVEWSPADGLSNPQGSQTTASPAASTEYTVTITHEISGCSLSESVSVDVVPPVDVLPLENQWLCDVVGLQLDAQTDFSGPLEWSWESPSSVDNPTIPNPLLAVNQTVSLSVTATNLGGCSDTENITITRLQEDTELGPDRNFCEDETVLLDTGWPSGYDVVWNTGAHASAISVTTSGTYHVIVTSPNGCQSEDQVTLTRYDYPVVDLGEDRELCEGEHVQLTGPEGDYNYSWSNKDQYSFTTVNETGYYELTVDNYGCTTTDGVNVIFNLLPERPFGRDTVFCFSMPPYRLELDAKNEGSSYVWMNGLTTQQLSVSNGQYVTVTITSGEGCEKTYDLIIQEECEGAVWIPNAFTPNGDGLNDAFKVEGDGIGAINMKILNKWGQIVYETDDINRPWLGQYLDGDEYKKNDMYQYVITVRMTKADGQLSTPYVYEGQVMLAR